MAPVPRGAQEIPDKIEQVLELRGDQARSPEVSTGSNWLFLGRGYNFPIALEGALKLKEISYIHAEGLPAAEMKHGPIALIDEGMPVVFIAPAAEHTTRSSATSRRSAPAGGKIIASWPPRATRRSGGTPTTSSTCRTCAGPAEPLLTVVPLQLLAYHAAVAARLHVDKPRNLAKSVTVE
jgi:glucosamine--fructose-6-phosphate aminotransferase (isomerizing)